MSAFAMEQLHLRLRVRASQEYPLDVPVPGPLLGQSITAPRSVLCAICTQYENFETKLCKHLHTVYKFCKRIQYPCAGSREGNGF